MKPSGFFALRTPLLPVEELLTWSEGTTAAAACAGDEASLAAALRADVSMLRRRLADVFRSPEVGEAVALASTSMAEVLASADADRLARAEEVCVKYLLRMVARPTPHGLMAGVTMGRTGAATRLELEDRARWRRKTRLDGSVLAAVCARFVGDIHLRRELSFRDNPDVYELAGELRWFRAASPDAFSTQLACVASSDDVEAVVARARRGARPGQLAAALRRRGHPPARAASIVDRLIDMRFLVADIEPPVTGPDALLSMKRALARGGPASRRAARDLGRIHAIQAEADSGGIVSPVGARALARGVLHLDEAAGPLFQVDLTKPGCATLSDPVVADVVTAVEVLHRIAPPVEDGLERFRHAFERRYGGRYVRLVDALDPEHGIPFSTAPPVPTWREAHDRLLELARAAWAEGKGEIALSGGDVAAMAAPRGQATPDALSVLFTLVAPPGGRGDFRIVIHSVDGPSGARMLGRASLTDPALRGAVAAHLRCEERLRPEAELVEIVWLRRQGQRNVVERPVLRRYEIAFGCVSGAPDARRLPITDLIVAVELDRIVVRSQRLQREVLPRVSCAVHWQDDTSHPLMRLLASLQRQGHGDPLRFDWGPLEGARVLPRVCRGRAILSRASWRLDTVLLRSARARGEVAAFMEVQRTREKNRLPRFVWLQERPGRSGDPPLLIDLDNALCVRLLLRAAARDPDLRLVEALPQPDAEVVRAPDGRYTHEIVLPLVTSRPVASREARELPEPRTRPSPGYPPGTRWLFAKLFTPTSSSDTLLCRVVAPVMRAALRAGAVRRWFFVRYSDPDPHLRLYALGPARGLVPRLLPALSRTLQRSFADGAIWRLELDTYEPEVERYGGLEGVGIAQRVFGFDTAATVALLERRPTRLERVRFVALGTDRMLTAAGASSSERLDIVGGARDRTAEDLDLDEVAARRRRGELFRRERIALSNVLATGAAWPELRARDAAIRCAAAALGRLATAGTLTRSWRSILSDLAHMHANRVFATEQRASELLALDLLWRHYRATELFGPRGR